MDRMSWLGTVGSNQPDFHFYVFHIDHVYAHVCVMLTWGLCQVPHIAHVYAHVCVMCTWGLCQVSRIDHVYICTCMFDVHEKTMSSVPLHYSPSYALEMRLLAELGTGWQPASPGSSSLCPPECWLAQYTLLSSQPSPNPQYNPCEMSTVSLLLE